MRRCGGRKGGRPVPPPLCQSLNFYLSPFFCDFCAFWGLFRIAHSPFRNCRLLHSTDTKRDSDHVHKLLPTPFRPFANWYVSGCTSRFRSFYEFSRLTTNRTLAHTVISFPLF